jgi:hypothetical protein
MRAFDTHQALLLLASATLGATACSRPAADRVQAAPIVGSWIVQDPNAPFPQLLYVFNGDGTMQQASPDAGDPRTSDSDGKGVWRARGDTVDARWVELLADRTTHQYVGRLELTMRITVVGDSLTAIETAKVFDTVGAEVPAPATPQPLRGTRITLP